MRLICSLSGALSGTDAAPRGVWIVFCYISEICSRALAFSRFLSALILTREGPHVSRYFTALPSPPARPLLLKLLCVR